MPENEQLNTLLSPRFLFQFSIPLKRKQPIWGPTGVTLDDSYKLLDLASLDAGTANQEQSA